MGGAIGEMLPCRRAGSPHGQRFSGARLALAGNTMGDREHDPTRQL